MEPQDGDYTRVDSSRKNRNPDPSGELEKASGGEKFLLCGKPYLWSVRSIRVSVLSIRAALAII